jgi:trehalose synthase-fused probable maltokinase
VRTLIEREALVPFLQRQRWFGSKARPVRAAKFLDWGVRKGQNPVFITIAEVEYQDGGRERYFIPLAIAAGAEADAILAATPQLALARVTGARKGLVIDGSGADGAAQALLETLDVQASFRTKRGTVRARQTPAFGELRGEGSLAPRRLGGEQSNTSIAFGYRLILKLFRRVESGPNPDVEIGEFLTTRTAFKRAPRVAASIEYELAGEPVAHLAVAQQFVSSQSDGWTHALGELGRFYDEVQHAGDPAEALHQPVHLLELAARPRLRRSRPDRRHIDSAQLLGRRTAELHLALSGDTTTAPFAPASFTREDIARLVAEGFAQITRARTLLHSPPETVSPEVVSATRDLLDRADRALHKMRDDYRMHALDVTTAKIRIHGDYHLGQVLWSEGDFYILDFEGEPARPLEERRQKESPIKDVAGMLRSFSYAAHAALFAHVAGPAAGFERLEPWGRVWERWAGAAFLKGYLAAAGSAPFIPADPAMLSTLLDLFLLDKALYELNYELNNRPDWVRIPLHGLKELLQ